LLVARNGEVWFANSVGLYRFDGTKTSRMLISKPSDQVASLTQSADGAIWLGTFDGKLRRWQDGSFTDYQPANDFSSTRFWALYPEANGTIWIGTMGRGLLRFTAGEFRQFTTADGLADDYISQILADDAGNLWLASHAGIMCVPKNSLSRERSPANPIPCRLFGRSDGLPTATMTLEFQPSCLKAHDGALWFASPKGATWVNPDDLRPLAPAPPILLEAVLADNTLREISEDNSGSTLPKITLEPGVKNLEVRFTSPTFTAPELTRFKYRLKKRDADWNDLGGQRSVSFNSLAAGEYTFQVTAENSDGRWSQRPAELRIIVEPYFWQRTSFQVLVLIGLLGIAAFTARRITQIRFRRKLEMIRQQQQIERERARIAQDLHDDLGAGLTEISMASDLADNPEISEHETRQYTHEIGARARELVQRMDEIVWAVNPRNDSLASLSSYACEYAQSFLQPLNIECALDVQPGLPEISLNAEQRYNFFLAFKEVINNIARHSGATKLSLAVHAENGNLVLAVEDNGRGFAPEAGRAGADGLRNIRERIARLKGECEISSQPDHGTRVLLRVPLNTGAANSQIPK
jgi:signal transduction histidine kinase